MANLKLERFRKLNTHPAVRWQGGLFRLPTWVRSDDGKPCRPIMAVWADADTGYVSQPKFVECDNPLETLLDALTDFGLEAGRRGIRPSVIETQYAEQMEFLKGRLAGTGTRVICVSNLPAMQAFIDDMAQSLSPREDPPAALSGRSVEVANVRAFAEASAAFFSARLWDELTDEDLIHVKSPTSPKGMAYLSVLGHGGQAYGLGFFGSLAQYEKMYTASSPNAFASRNGVWSIQFGDITELPIADADLWDAQGFPVVADDAYPSAFWFGPKKVRRPDVKELDFITGLLQSLAGVDTDDLDRGEWTRSVQVSGRTVEYKFALVHELEDEADVPSRAIASVSVLRAMERQKAAIQRLLADHEFETAEEANAFLQQHLASIGSDAPPPRSPLEQAQEIIYEAWDAKGRRRRVLANKALEICKDCADAYVVLAEDSSGPDEAVTFYRNGVEAGERALGTEFFNDNAGEFWLILETRPYMRAKFGLAQCLWTMGHKEEAVSHYEDILRLNPNDNQGARLLLAACLLEMNDGEKLAKLFDAYEDEASAQWQYVRALWAYRQEGDSRASRRIAKEAFESNRHVVEFLSGRRHLPSRLPDSYQFGAEDEAVHCAVELQNEWTTTPGAIEWLETVGSPRKAKSRRK